MVREGDIVEIPLPDGRTAIGWILHISKTFKNAVGFVVFGIKGELREDAVLNPETLVPASLSVLGPLYTHADAIKHYGWRTFASQPITSSKLALTKRLVGGDVYVGDQYLGMAEELGELDLKPMLAMGMPVVFAEIERAFRVKN